MTPHPYPLLREEREFIWRWSPQGGEGIYLEMLFSGRRGNLFRDGLLREERGIYLEMLSSGRRGNLFRDASSARRGIIYRKASWKWFS